jgi:glycyl-tRNA synthetase beta chain
MKTRDLLVEIGTEELPPKALKKLSRAFHDGVLEGLKIAELSHAGIQTFASPRRLALLITALQEGQLDKVVEKRGPALIAAFDDEGCPTNAAMGFARGCGVEVDQLDKLETDKGTWLAYSQQQAGQTTVELLPEIIQKSLDNLPIPKRMRWGSLKEQFVRPVHWAILLFGDEVIDAQILSVKTGRETRGHRFHHPHSIYIGEPSAYAPLLESEGYVIADFETRRESIRGQILEVARQVNAKAVIDTDLLDEVTSMVEWPQAVLGNFDNSFLDVPAEALISAMKGHQKYFHLVDKNDKLMPHFITISNIVSKDPDKVREGNERVIRPRLSDAEFFWKQDQKVKLSDQNERLKNVVFQSKLGSVFDKVQRITRLTITIATTTGWDVTNAERSALLCKADLMTEMVGEFPDLQGIMGRYYATLDGENAEVAQAIDEHYMPRFSGDALPETTSGLCVSLADKIDTLVGIFAIGQAPSGDKDPFALRRAALGVLRILIERGLDLDLDVLINQAVDNYTQQKAAIKTDTTTVDVYEFILARLQVYYSRLGYAHDEIDAVLCLKPTQLQDGDKRLRALAAFRQLPEAESLAAANKRISNILKKSTDKIPDKWSIDALTEKEEKKLAKEVDALIPKLAPLFEKQDYETAMKKLASLRNSIDAFFDKVMVMSDDKVLRCNRLAILNTLRNQFLRVADISRLQ